MKKTAKHLYNIKDVRDELNILKTIAEFQQEVQSSMARDDPDAARNNELTAEYILKDIKELDKSAGQTQAAVSWP